jgi:starch synthase
MTSMRVLSVTSEIYPVVKTGGLADVAGALPGALAAEGVQVRSLVPGYPAVMAALREAVPVLNLPGLFGAPARVLAGKASGLTLYCLDAPHLYDRPGSPYGSLDGADWPDNLARFAALSQAGAMLGRGAAGWAPDVVHAHDWQAGLAPAYLHFGGGARPATVMTVHNLAFQGRFPAGLFDTLGLPSAAWGIDGLEYYGGIGTLKAGLRLADRITTVSPTYAAEIAAPGGGMGLDGLLRSRHADLSGILNGLDTAVWNPAADPHIAAQYGVHRLRRRARNKAALQTLSGLAPNPGALLFGAIGRLTDQKGMDLLLAAIPALLSHGAQLVVLGAGDPALEAGLAAAAASYPGQVAAKIGFDEVLAHAIQAGCDALLVPSRFEPCGLVQMCALRYGALPVVARVGGLADTVIDANPAALGAGVATGFTFAPVTLPVLEGALARVAALWRHPSDWAQTQRNAMRAEVGWTGPARAYAALYKAAAGR